MAAVKRFTWRPKNSVCVPLPFDLLNVVFLPLMEYSSWWPYHMHCVNTVAYSPKLPALASYQPLLDTGGGLDPNYCFLSIHACSLFFCGCGTH